MNVLAFCTQTSSPRFRAEMEAFSEGVLAQHMRRSSFLLLLLLALSKSVCKAELVASQQGCAHYKAYSSCFYTRSTLEACLERHPEMQECLISEAKGLVDVIASGFLAVDNACAESLRQEIMTVEGTEALLSSGRLLAFFSLLFVLLQDAAQGGAIPGFLIYAHLQSTGSADSCSSIEGHHYCWVAPSILPQSKAGVCVPEQCSLNDVPVLLNPILGYLSNGTVVLTLDNIVGQCGDFRFHATPVTYVMIVVTAILVALVVAATFVDWHVEEQKRKQEEANAPDGYTHLEGDWEEEEEDGGAAEDLELANADDTGGTILATRNDVSAEDKVRVRKVQDPGMHVLFFSPMLKRLSIVGLGVVVLVGSERGQPSLGAQLLRSFSLYKTMPSLLAPPRPGDFNTLDGVRTFSMSWVVLGHLFLWPTQYNNYSNQEAILPPKGLMATYTGQALIGGEFAVDTFFTISAFLACYMLTQFVLKRLRPTEGETKPLGFVWVPMLYFQRWLRLTPTYFFVLLFYWHVMRLLDSGPFWGALSADYDACDKYWWTNILYINTLVPWDTLKVCYAVSWYMSVEFILFLALPFLALAYAYNRVLGYAIPTLLWITSVIYSWNLAYRKNLSQFFTSNPEEYQIEYYFKFYTRAPPYLVGVLLAFIWSDMVAFGLTHSQQQTRTIRRPRLTWGVVGAFALSFFLLGSVVYGVQPFFAHPDENPVWLDHWYLAMSRSAWAVGLCILLFLLFQGYGAVIVAILDNQLVAVLSRLTFCAYLIHPAVLSFTFADQQTTAHYSVFWITSQFLGVLTVVFLLSMVVHLLVEKPFSNIERLLLRGGEQRAATIEPARKKER